MSALTEWTDDLIGRGVAASRPAAGIKGRLYIASDTNAISRDNGTSWDTLTVGSALTVKDEGGALTTAADTLDFVGAGVVASGTGGTKTITIAGASALTVEEVDGSPTDAAITKIVFPNDSVSIASHIATVRQVPYGFIGCKNTSGSVTLSNGAYASPAFASADTYDSDNFHDTSTNNTRFTIPAGLGGKYHFEITADWPATGQTDRRVGYRINGGSDNFIARDYFVNAGVSLKISASVDLDLVAGDYFEARIYTDSGAGTAGCVVSLTKLDSGRVGQGIGARATNTAGTSLANNTPTAMPFATEDWDTDGFHDTVTNNSRMTIPAGLGGKYIAVGQYTLGAAVTATSIYAHIRKTALSGGTVTYHAFSRGGNNTSSSEGLNVVAIVDVLPGDYLELEVNQNKGSAQTLETTAGYNSLTISRLDSGSGVGGWNNWTATVTQSGAVTITGQNCRYMQVGSITHFEGSIDLGGSGSSGSAIVIGGQPAALQGSAYTSYGGSGYRLIGHGKLARGGVWFKAVDIYAIGATDWRMVLYDDFQWAGAAGTNAAFALTTNDNIEFRGSIPTA